MTEPLVLLPGMMCDARLFGPQIEAFGSTRETIVLDITVSDTMAGLAQHVLDHAPPHFALGGLSMGGIVAMEAVRLAPDRVTRLALLDTNPLAELDEVKSRRAGQIARVEVGRLDSVMRDEMKPNYLANGARRNEILDVCMTMALDLGPEVFVRQSVALRDRIDQSETLRSYPRPALVLCGRDDQLCPLSRHQLMQTLLPDATLTIVDGAGHLPTLEQPETTNAALAAWLAR